MLLLKPFLGCNLRCRYCYEGQYRAKERPKMDYNLDAVFKRMEEFKEANISLHGGEPLCMPKKDVEAILAKIFELKGKSGIQTNATLIDDEFIAMFKKYKTSVGVSWDGPGDLSKFRPGSAKVGATIERLVKESIPTSVIIVLSRSNAGTPQKLKKLKNYLLYLHQLRITGRINPACGATAAGYELSPEKAKQAYLELADFCLKRNLKWSPFEDIINGLQGKPRVCTFMSCDPFSTPSATVVLADGSLTSCMRTNRKQILLRHPAYHKTREEILSQTPQQYGGCQGCQYFFACYGGCPTAAIDNDWRNRTRLCPAWKGLFQFFENVLGFCGIPVLKKQPEQCSVKDQPGMHTDGSIRHADHTDSRHSDSSGSGYAHGDSPHGDSHGDHMDAGYCKHQDHSDINHGDGSHGDHSDIRHGDSG